MSRADPRLPYEDDERERSRKALALLATLLLHALGGYAIWAIDPIARVKQVIVEVTMATPPEPEPEPEPEPPPEPPPPPPPRPTEVDARQTTDTPTPEAPPETLPAEQPVRLVQGLSASSFAVGAGSGFAVRAGTTLRTGAGDDTMNLDEAASHVAFSAVTKQPRVRSWPRVDVPDTVKALGLEGTVGLLLDIDREGRVTRVEVQDSLHPDADAACIAAWKKASIAPALQGEVAVGVKNVPYRCRIEILQ